MKKDAKVQYDLNREIKNIPIKKPVGIIRCKNCGYSRLRTGYDDRYVCTRWNNTTGKNEFCSYGYKSKY